MTDKPEERDDGAVYQTWIEKAKTDKAAAELLQKVHHRPAEELYDLANDPYELNNLAADPDKKETLEQLRNDVVVWRAELNDNGETREALVKHLRLVSKCDIDKVVPEYRKYLKSE